MILFQDDLDLLDVYEFYFYLSTPDLLVKRSVRVSSASSLASYLKRLFCRFLWRLSHAQMGMYLPISTTPSPILPTIDIHGLQTTDTILMIHGVPCDVNPTALL